MPLTKIFWSGRSQAVRIPKELRLQGDEATIRKVGTSLIIEPVTVDWAWIDRLHSRGGIDLEMAEASLEATPMPERSPGEELFTQ